MKLADLDPRWFAEDGRHGQGLTFDCPCCVGKPNGVRLAAAFVPTLDGGPVINLTPRVCYPTLNQVPGVVTVPPGIHWQRQGDTFETLSLSPSIDASRAGHWHGFITNGAIS